MRSPVFAVQPRLSWRLRLRDVSLAACASLGLLQTMSASLAVPAGGIAIPPPTRVERFNPDAKVCQPAAIQAGFARQLQPWSDQPPAVLERLRQVQLEMTHATVQRCVSKGLLSAADAADLERKLGLSSNGGPAPAAGGASGAAAPIRP